MYANKLEIRDEIHSKSFEKLYTCKYCAKKFNFIGGVIANGEKPFICGFLLKFLAFEQQEHELMMLPSE